MALGTKWGLLRHWWVAISLLLTTFATGVLLVEMRTITALGEVAANPRTSADDLRARGSTVPHSMGGTVVLLVILVLNVARPQGMTPYGWRKREQERRASSRCSGVRRLGNRRC